MFVRKLIRECVPCRGQGFVDECRENMVNNAEHANMSFDEFSAEFDKFLDAYVKGHENVPVYNRIQWMGQRLLFS